MRKGQDYDSWGLGQGQLGSARFRERGVERDEEIGSRRGYFMDFT